MRIFIFITCLIFLFACSKESGNQVPNPFEANNKGKDGDGQDTLNPASFAGLHKKIFSTKCAMPLCHDGTFEPDFRTIESAYNSLVYHPVVKNNANHDFTYRVVPHNPDKSWLMERLITDDPVLGRMPIYAEPLSPTEMDHIRAWINAGCPDVNGKVAQFPNLQPQVITRFALDMNQNRLDTTFAGRFPAPFLVPNGLNFNLVVQVRDDSTQIAKLKNLSFRFSYDKNDFNNAISKSATYFGQEFIYVTLNSSEFQLNKPIYFRFYCRDDHHTTDAEYPNNSTQFFIKDLYAFQVH